jgi:hypothetical protein
MIDLRFIKPDVIYRNISSYRLPVNTKQPLLGSVYIPVSKTSMNSIKVFANPMWHNRYLSLYFHEKLFNYKTYSILHRYRIQNHEITDLFEKELHPILPNIDMKLNKIDLRKRNYIQDMSELNNRFFTMHDSRVGLVRVNEYFRLFKDFTVGKVDSSQYTNKVLIIPIDEWVSDTKEQSLYQLRRTDNFISVFFLKLKNDFEYFVSNFGDWKFYFTLGKQLFFMKPNTFTKDTFVEFKALLLKLHPATSPIEKVDEESPEVVEATNKTKIADKLAEKIDDIDHDTLTTLIDKSVQKNNIDLTNKNLVVDDNTIISGKELELEKVMDDLNQTVPKSKVRAAREIKLVQEMKNIKFDDTTIGEIQARANINKLEEIDIPVDTINPNWKKMKFVNFDEAYLKNNFKPHLVNMMASLQYKDRPLYMIDASVTDVSDKLNLLEEYSFKFEDEKGRRHTFTIHLPKFINHRFMKIGGNKKIMINQIIPIPITKTKPDTVQIATNYQKSFITRFGKKISPKVILFYKKMANLFNEKVKVDLGTAKGNNQFITTIEYDELSSKYRKIILPDITIYFSQLEIRDRMKKLNIQAPERSSHVIPLAMDKNNNVIYLDTSTNKIPVMGIQLIDYVIEQIGKYDTDFITSFKSTPWGKTYMYSRAKIMDKYIPIVILLAYLDGLVNLMKRANINYRIITKTDSKSVPDYKKNEEEVIEFSDAWLVYNIYPLRNILLMSGFNEVPTKIYEIKQFLSKEVYHEIFDTLFGRSNIGYAFENFEQLFIDPMTEEVLKDYNLPTDFIDVFLYANTLLEDNSYIEEGNQNYTRIRCNEMINAFLYNSLAKAYERYRLTADRVNPEKISIRKDKVIIDILTSQVTNDYSDLNPIYTLDLMRSTTYKGPAGMNEDRSFNLSKRSYHPTMVGVLSQASPISGSIGIARTLTVNPNIISTKGYVQVSDTKDKIKSLSTSQLASGAEAALAFSMTSDEPERVAMASAQSRHTLACIGSDRNLVYTGFEKVLPHIIGDTFVFKAKNDGKVEKIDDKNNIMILRYVDGKTDIVNLNAEIGKNSGAGFFISNKLSPLVKAGDVFVKGKLVAHNAEFFTIDKRTGDSVYMAGPLARIAFRYGSKTFEDSSIISKRLADKMASHIAKKKDIVLGFNSNIDYLVKKGQEIKVNDPLIVFDTSHDDELTNKLLDRIKDDYIDAIIESSKTNLISKLNGVVEDIKIYYTVPKEELSKSARQVIEFYEKDNADRLKEISKIEGVDINTITLTEVEKIIPGSTGKVKGVKVGKGILIEIYIKYKDEFGIGDKSTSFIACKTITGDVWEPGQEPYLLSNHADKVDIFLGVLSVGARMTHSLVKTSQSQAVLVGMKPNIKDLFNKVYEEKVV